MCGITGVAHAAGPPVDLSVLTRMADALVHRGPDSFGYYVSGNIALGIRRLRVIDLVTGDQPIGNEDGSIQAVLNGEIYNFVQLRAELESAGHIFSTRSDTEVIVHAYEEHGDDFVAHLRGMFALALWDEHRRRLVLARDRLGKKPLLYAHLGGDLLFASEMRGLLASSRVPRDVDFGALGDYLAYGYVPTPATAFRAVRKVPAGHLLVWQDGRVALRRFWSLSYGPKFAIDESRATDELEAVLSEAVRLRLIADVPVGALLSGGVDSSVVVALMSRHTDRVKTFSIGFEEAAFDELAHARRVAEMYRTDHHEMVVRPDAASVLPQLVRHFGEPFADSSAIPTFYVAQLARGVVTVALSGDGGDENFAGYDRYRGMALARAVGGVPASWLLGRAGLLASRVVPGMSARTRGRMERFLWATRLTERDRYSTWVSTMRPDLWRALLDPGVVEEVSTTRTRAVERVFDEHTSLGSVDRLLSTDIHTYLLDDLLVKMDIASMANSLETRSPFLDHEVMEFAARLPERFKLGPGGQQKYLLKKLARRLIPSENIDRPKQGFGVPVGQWLRSSLRDTAESILFADKARERGLVNMATVRTLWSEHQRGTVDRTLPLWTLLMLEMWFSEFVDVPS